MLFGGPFSSLSPPRKDGSLYYCYNHDSFTTEALFLMNPNKGFQDAVCPFTPRPFSVSLRPFEGGPLFAF